MEAETIERPVNLTVRVSRHLYERLDRHRKETGTPITAFGARALQERLDRLDGKPTCRARGAASPTK